MGDLDSFVDRWATSCVRPGETVNARAHVRRKPHGRNNYQEWLIAVTNYRVIFFGAKETMTLGIAPDQTGRPFAVELRDLKDVWLRDTPGITSMRRMTFVPISGRGPRELDSTPLQRRPDLSDIESRDNVISLDIPAATRGMDDQQRFYSSYPQWLQQQVQARAFWGPEEHAALVAEAEAAVAEQQRKDALAQKRKEQLQAAAATASKAAAKTASVALPLFKRYWPVLLYFAALGLFVIGVVLVVSNVDDYMHQQRNLRRSIICDGDMQKQEQADLAWAKAGELPPTDCPEQLLVKRHSELGCGMRIRASEFDCHSCFVNEAYGSKGIRRGNKYWSCPDASELEKRIAERGKRLKGYKSELDSPSETNLLAGAGALACAFFGVVLLGLGLIFRYRIKKRLRAAAAPPGAPA